MGGHGGLSVQVVLAEAGGQLDQELIWGCQLSSSVPQNCSSALCVAACPASWHSGWIPRKVLHEPKLPDQISATPRTGTALLLLCSVVKAVTGPVMQQRGGELHKGLDIRRGGPLESGK